MPYIKDCKAPDLTDLYIPVTKNYLLNLMFIGAGPKDQAAKSFLHSFLMVTDKALREYNAARELLIQYIASANQTMLYLEALGRFESCINSVKRGLGFADRMAAYPQSPKIERTLRRLFKLYYSTIKPLRDAIEHIDEDIISGGIAEGEARALTLTRDGECLEITRYRLTFTDLASVLRRLHALAVELSRHQGGTRTRQ